MVRAAANLVHSEWSGTQAEPRRADGADLCPCHRDRLPAVIFTDHLDLDDAWRTTPMTSCHTDDTCSPRMASCVQGSGHCGLPRRVERSRHRFPELRIRIGVEVGQPLSVPDPVNGSLPGVGEDRSEGAADRTWQPSVLPRRVVLPSWLYITLQVRFALRASAASASSRQRPRSPGGTSSSDWCGFGAWAVRAVDGDRSVGTYPVVVIAFPLHIGLLAEYGELL